MVNFLPSFLFRILIQCGVSVTCGIIATSKILKLGLKYLLFIIAFNDQDTWSLENDHTKNKLKNSSCQRKPWKSPEIYSSRWSLCPFINNDKLIFRGLQMKIVYWHLRSLWWSWNDTNSFLEHVRIHARYSSMAKPLCWNNWMSPLHFFSCVSLCVLWFMIAWEHTLKVNW